MKTLIFTDSTSISVEDSSSISCVICKVNSFNDIQAIYSKFTEDNLKRVTLDGVVYTDILFSSCNAHVVPNGKIEISFINRTRSFEEIASDQLTELQEAVAELATGGM